MKPPRLSLELVKKMENHSMLELVPPIFIVSIEETKPGLSFDVDGHAERILLDERDGMSHCVARK